MDKPAANVDEFLAAVPSDARGALQNLRKIIKSAAPGAVEGISYRVPVFKLDGHLLVGFNAAKDHCTFFMMSLGLMRTHARDLKGYKLGRGSILFPAKKPLPAALVKKIVKARILENAKRFSRSARFK
jgi:uncharacterized protein YdhG (YjbR/CyaY superfamily)